MSEEPIDLHARLRPVDNPDGLLLVLHGRGADEHDLQPLLERLDPNQRMVGALARAPFTMPPGGFHWYVVPRVGYPHAETFFASLHALDRLVDRLCQQYGLARDRVALAGFSQGAVMSLSLGLLSADTRPAAIVAMSGFVPVVEGYSPDPDAARGLPVALTHGTLDPVIDISFGRAAAEALRELEADVSYTEYEIGHSIDEQFLSATATWLALQLPHGA